MLKNNIKLRDGATLTVHSDVVGKNIGQTKQYYEHQMLEYIKSLGKSKVAVDIGSNIGNHSIYFAKYCADYVYSIEPIKKNADLIRENIENNKLSNVFVFEVGLGKEEGKAGFKPIPNMNEINLVKSPKGHIDIMKPESIIKEPFQLVKIDCNSMTGEIFEAMIPMLKEYKPHIFVEATPFEIQSYSKMVGGKIGKKFNATPTWHIYF